MNRSIYIFPGWAFPSEALHPLVRALDACSIANMPETADILLGWSLGGIHALMDSSDKPRILISATARFCAEPPDWPGVPDTNLRALRRQLDRDPEGALRGFHRLCAGDHAGESELEQRCALSLALGTRALARGLDELARLDARPCLRDATAPALMIHGADDAVISIGAARATAARLPNVRLHVHPDAGHDLPLTRVAWVAEQARAFLSEIDRASYEP